ncbi:phenylalanine--tRNA ligase subunit beta [Desulforegula conservatrix]|uniref:phenylalanine--tRNA ligase subunit beta n=1 Tax=Desulforegula conservatrix TaxID=153026 RepID=UPI0003FB7482|nr:phenylalanine--tRNA ligase subunit beta [Desulforegula conservatrix]
MKFSTNWLSQYVTINTGIDELSAALTMTGLEVDALHDRFAWLETIVAARIEKTAPHPNADKLKLCKVFTGKETIDIVCGAPNAKEGMIVPLALPGCVMPDGSVIKQGKIRGESSSGMLCSARELEIGEAAGGLLELDASIAPGTPLNKALNLSDHVFEIGLTPNRADCLSILGIAREVASIQKSKITKPELKISEAGGEAAGLAIVVIENPELCPRYAAKIILGAKIAPSPAWLQDRLKSVGLKPINNVVDITNFVMLETGQPLHAFDYDNLAGKQIIVRTAKEGDEFTTLDSKKRKLEDGMLMICDGEKPVAIAGVMGGENSEISDSTVNILLESAYFNPASIRKTAKVLGLGTDASHRFERGIDPLGTLYAAERAATLIAELTGGRLTDGTIDVNPVKFAPKPISISATRTNRLLGTNFSPSMMADMLRSIEFETQIEGDIIVAVPPSFRVDVTIPEDLMEEIARLSGYDNIPVTFPAIATADRTPASTFEFRMMIKRILTGLGFYEAINYSFISPKSYDRLGLSEIDSRRNSVEILNPLSEELAVMRTSLLPGIFDTMRKNISQQERNLRMFEVGKTFMPVINEKLPKETETLSIAWTGVREPNTWHSKSDSVDFYDIKGAAEAIFDNLRIRNVVFEKPDLDLYPYARPGYCTKISIDGKEAGILGEINPAVLKAYDIKQSALFMELNLDIVKQNYTSDRQYKQTPKYPSTSRDITLIIDKAISSAEIMEKIGSMKESLLETSWVCAVYEGTPVPEEKRSVSVRFVYRSAESTLEDDAVNKIHNRISDELRTGLGAVSP